MKKTILALAVVFTLSTGTFAQSQQDSTKIQKHKSASGAKYTCTMHPEVVMNKPGKCPKCGMTLVKMKSKKADKPKGDMKM